MARITLSIVLVLLFAGTPIRAHNGSTALAYPVPAVDIDGDLSDWPASLPSYRLNSVSATSLEDSADFQGQFRIGYNSVHNALFVSLEIEDDVTVLDLPNARVRMRDSGGFALLPVHSAAPAEHFGVWDDSTRPFMGFPTKQVEKRFVQCAVRREEGRHSYEWKLDVAGLDMGQIEPNKVWSLAVVVVDADGDQRDSVSFISWGKASEGYGYSLVGDILLVPKTEPFGTIEGQVAWTDDEGEAPPRQVRIVSEADSSFHIRTVTDRNGCFMAALPAGSYAVAVEDFRMAHGLPISARVQAGQTVSLGVHEAARIIPSTYHREPADLQSVHRGVCWEAGGNDLTEYHMVPLVQSGVEWISQTTFGWQSKHNSPEIRPNRSGGGESDRGIADVSRLAKRFGIRTMLKPHIWLGRGAWRGDIAMDSEEDWQEWFSQYRSFILRYARLADREGIEVLCIGTELRRAAVEREADWRKLIAEIRAVYNGKLIYAANWYKEFEEVAFWDELDYIGIQAYFPLVEKERFDVSKWTGGERISSVEDLSRGWDKHVEAIARIHEKFRKPVIITEIGYHSTIDAAVQPWEWKISDLDATFEEGLRTQANCYEAFLKVFWGREFFAGVYFWKWHPYHHDAGGSQDRDYTPQNKPAELMMRRWYQRFVD